MEEAEIIRLNVELYRRLLQTDLDERTRDVVQAMLFEFELKLLRQRRARSRRLPQHDLAGERGPCMPRRMPDSMMRCGTAANGSSRIVQERGRTAGNPPVLG
jgi:hypothetical protein